MIKTFRYRIYPTKKQTEALNAQLAICCELYNAALQERRDAWKLEHKSISFFDQVLQLRHVKAIREDIANINAYVLENVLKRVDHAFVGFFVRVKKGHTPGYPRFRSVRRYDSITFRQWSAPKPTNGKLRLSKIGSVRIRQHREMTGDIKTLTIKRETGRWFALFTVECESSLLPFNPNAIGIDVGIATFATLSNGAVIENPRFMQDAAPKLRRLARRIARRRKGSQRRQKAALALRHCHNSVRNRRRDFLHKVSRRLINENGLIAVEDLNIKGLASGMLSTQVLDAAWSTFMFMLAYKAEEAGRVFVKVDPCGTSQTCICGAEVRKTLKERFHVCLSCGLVGNRDHVSAQIILSRAGAQPSGVNVGEVMPCVA